MQDATITRRTFTTAGLTLGASALLGITGCASSSAGNEGNLGAEPMEPAAAPQSPQSNLPAANPDPDSPFGVDESLNMETIDQYLFRDDTVYRDMRMLDDPADYEAIGGNSKLDITLEGFKTVPYPYLGTLQDLPVAGAYDGPCLFEVEWGTDGTVVQAKPRYRQSNLIVEELFPKDKNLVLVCGGGGYAGMMRQLLISLGWDSEHIYNAGGVWDYAGNHSVQLITYENPEAPTHYSWRAEVANIRFEELEPLT